jgi:hypothetical protein
MMEYLKAKMDELEINSKIKISWTCYMGIIDFKKSYRSKTNIVKDEKADLVTGSHSILAS